MTKQTASICILYGFCEGPHSGRRLTRLLQQAGYTLSSDPQTADIVLAHSGGCFVIPPTPQAKRLIMIGLPFTPGKSTARALLEKNRAEFRYFRRQHHLVAWLHKLCWHSLYFWKMPTNFRMLQAQRQGAFWQLQRVTVIRNRDDLCCTPDCTALMFGQPPALIALSGQHDDLWLHPEPYLDIINYYAK